jgi:hypothetical protein
MTDLIRLARAIKAADARLWDLLKSPHVYEQNKPPQWISDLLRAFADALLAAPVPDQREQIRLLLYKYLPYDSDRPQRDAILRELNAAIDALATLEEPT